MTLLSMIDPETGKYTIMTVDVKATFHIADDLFLWQKQSSKFGGLFKKDTQYLERRPASISLEDAETLMSWFDMIALKHFSQQLKMIIGNSVSVKEAGRFLE
jgi:hypothetical protein